MLCSVTPAIAARVHLEAEVRSDLRSIVGELHVQDADGLRFVDALARLPVPTDDVLLRRTYPFAVEEGWVHIREVAPGRYRFHAMIPRRYGASGHVPGHGLFMNGLWHPQPVDGARAVDVDWTVRLRLPPGTTGVLNDTVGDRELTWSGDAERLSLAVVSGARVAPLETDTGRARLLSTQGPLPRRDARLAEIIDAAWPLETPLDLVIVVAPLRRRLVRAGNGVLFISDRALRLSAGLWQFHVEAVQRGVLETALPVEPRFERELAAAIVSAARAPDIDLRESLGWLAWIPEVDSLLYDGRLPFYEDAFGEVWPPDPVADDLSEMFDRSTPARALARRLDAALGAGTANRLAAALLRGHALDDSLQRAAVPRAMFDAWRPWPPGQQLSVAVTPGDDGSATLEVARSGPETLPAEPVVVDVDGDRITWMTPQGPAVHRVALPSVPERVALDPDGLVNQPVRDDDRWPRPLTMTAAFFPYELNVRGGGLSAAAWLSVRRQYSTRWRLDASLETSPSDIIGGTLGAVRAIGPLQDRRNRPLRLAFGAGPSLLDPDFRPLEGTAVSLDGYASISWDTRVDRIFPRHGHRLHVGGSGGVVPGQTAWSRASAGALKLVPVGGRIVLAARASGALASGAVEHRLLSLGGSSNVQGLAPDRALGTARLTSTAELRWQAVRQASVPMPLMWLSDVQVSAGLDAGALRTPDCATESDPCWSTAVGWSTGLLGTADVLGARPTSLGVGVAGPVSLAGPGLSDRSAPIQIYLRLTQAF